MCTGAFVKFARLVNLVSFLFQNGSKITVDPNEMEMQEPLHTEEGYLNEENKKRNSFEWCHMIYDSTSLLLSIALTIIGANYIDAKIDPCLFSLVITEMQIFGLILKSTYYLYVHPWEKLNTRHSIYVKVHGAVTVLFVIGFFITVYSYGVTSIKILSICILVLLMPIGSVSFYSFF